MITKSSTRYYLTYEGFNGGTIAPEGYSKYHDRYVLYDQGNIKHDEIYGFEQAIEHIKELKEKPHYQNTNFVIEITTTTVTSVPYNSFIKK